MGKANLAGFGPAPAADDRRHRSVVVRFVEGALAADPAIGQKTRERVDHRGFKRLGGGKWRQDARQARGEHGFARPRRTDQHHVMPPRRRNLEGAFGAFLALHIAQVALGRKAGNLAGFRRRQGVLAG